MSINPSLVLTGLQRLKQSVLREVLPPPPPAPGGGYSQHQHLDQDVGVVMMSQLVMITQYSLSIGGQLRLDRVPPLPQ